MSCLRKHLLNLCFTSQTLNSISRDNFLFSNTTVKLQKTESMMEENSKRQITAKEMALNKKPEERKYKKDTIKFG